MISFYPGPSRVHDQIPLWVAAAHQSGVLSMSHRSEEFMTLVKNTVVLLKQRLNIPKDYSIFFTSSATECWEVIAQSVITDKSIHVFNGAFGEKWWDYTRRIKAGAEAHRFDREHLFESPGLIFKNGDVICITQNETSNGTQIPVSTLGLIRKHNPNHLIAVDATSSMAGLALDFLAGDIWFASVQKCFGLPAGLAVMICSPKAMKRIKRTKEDSHYNSLGFMAAMMEKWQTPFTPNVLGIYLLWCAARKMKNIKKVDHRLENQRDKWVKFFLDSKKLTLLVNKKEVRSTTVLAVKGDPTVITEVKAKAKKAGLLLGEGYGDLKQDTFRIANFPAIPKKEISKLMDFLSRYR